MYVTCSKLHIIYTIAAIVYSIVRNKLIFFGVCVNIDRCASDCVCWCAGLFFNYIGPLFTKYDVISS